jgi:hypothetical protein
MATVSYDLSTIGAPAGAAIIGRSATGLQWRPDNHAIHAVRKSNIPQELDLGGNTWMTGSSPVMTG